MVKQDQLPYVRVILLSIPKRNTTAVGMSPQEDTVQLEISTLDFENLTRMIGTNPKISSGWLDGSVPQD